MQSLAERIADREARGKELAKEASPDGKPTKEQIEAATTQTIVAPGTTSEELKAKGGGNKAPEWKANA
jgi:hypothetical protein